MRLTNEVLQAAYAYLNETGPFVDWNLPDAEDVYFQVTNWKNVQGQCNTVIFGDKYQFRIQISQRFHLYTFSLMQTMAHEMVHMHQRQNCRNHGKQSHGADFQALAREVCAYHGFDPGQF